MMTWLKRRTNTMQFKILYIVNTYEFIDIEAVKINKRLQIICK